MGSNYCLKNRAFSLLELLIAVTILSVGIIAVLQSFSFSARVSGLSCDIINAVFLAEDKIQELEFKEKKSLIEEKAVQDKKDKFTYRYTLSLEPELRLYKLDFDISWKRANREERLDIGSYLKQ